MRHLLLVAGWAEAVMESWPFFLLRCRLLRGLGPSFYFPFTKGLFDAPNLALLYGSCRSWLYRAGIHPFLPLIPRQPGILRLELGAQRVEEVLPLSQGPG